MSLHPYGSCHNEDCPACPKRAEDRRDDPGYADDWQIGQAQYERHMDVMGGSL